MEKFVLNEKVITKMHMQTINLKQRTKFVKKYDMPFPFTQQPNERQIIQALIQKQRKAIKKTISDEVVAQNLPKTKNLLSTLKIDEIFRGNDENSAIPQDCIKQNYFTVSGIKKNLKQLNLAKKNVNRTGSLVSVMKFSEHYVGPYDVNPDLKFKRSPRCYILPQGKKGNMKQVSPKFKLIEDKQNQIQGSNIFKQSGLSKLNQSSFKSTIKQIVEREIQQLIKKRRAICRTAPTKHIQKLNARHSLQSVEYGLLQEDINRVQAKIYLQMRQNRQKAIKRNKERIGINIENKKPLSSLEINKNTVNLLKKYKCDNMAYFMKFLSKQ